MQLAHLLTNNFSNTELTSITNIVNLNLFLLISSIIYVCITNTQRTTNYKYQYILQTPNTLTHL